MINVDSKLNKKEFNEAIAANQPAAVMTKSKILLTAKGSHPCLAVQNAPRH